MPAIGEMLTLQRRFSTKSSRGAERSRLSSCQPAPPRHAKWKRDRHKRPCDFISVGFWEDNTLVRGGGGATSLRTSLLYEVVAELSEDWRESLPQSMLLAHLSSVSTHSVLQSLTSCCSRSPGHTAGPRSECLSSSVTVEQALRTGGRWAWCVTSGEGR